MSSNVSRNWTDAYTADRPPRLNDRNFPSAQADGPANGPDDEFAYFEEGFESLSMDHVSYSAPSLVTASSDNTLTGNNGPDHVMEVPPMAEHRDYIPYYVSNDPLKAGLHDLTAAALVAHDHDIQSRNYPGPINMVAWCQESPTFAQEAGGSTYLSDSMMMPERPRSPVTEATSSAWSIVSYNEIMLDDDEKAVKISGAGAVFDDDVAPTAYDMDMEEL